MENSVRVLGVLAGRDVSKQLLLEWANTADRIIAADAGADLLLEVHALPHEVIGDMDSISFKARSATPNQILMTDQETTDCDKLLQRAADEGHAALTLAGVEGDLPDHVLAILQSAARSPLDIRLAYRRGLGWIIKPDRPRKLATKPGRRLSLLGLECCEGVHLNGCTWPLDDANLGLQGATSISNRTEANEVTVTMNKGAALLFIEFPTDEMPVW